QAALVRDARLQRVVVGADAVGRDHQHLLGPRRGDARGHVQLADLAGDDVVPARQLRGLDQRGGGGAHALSSAPRAVARASAAARRAMSVRWWLPARTTSSVAARARARACSRSVPVATTDSTRPPALTRAPSARPVPAWMTCAPCCSQASIPVIGSPERAEAG